MLDAHEVVANDVKSCNKSQARERGQFALGHFCRARCCRLSLSRCWCQNRRHSRFWLQQFVETLLELIG